MKTHYKRISRPSSNYGLTFNASWVAFLLIFKEGWISIHKKTYSFVISRWDGVWTPIPPMDPRMNIDFVLMSGECNGC